MTPVRVTLLMESEGLVPGTDFLAGCCCCCFAAAEDDASVAGAVWNRRISEGD